MIKSKKIKNRYGLWTSRYYANEFMKEFLKDSKRYMIVKCEYGYVILDTKTANVIKPY